MASQSVAGSKSKESPAKQNGKAADAKNDYENDEQEAVEMGAKGEATKDMKNVTNFVNEELANRQVDADKLGKSLNLLQEAAKSHKIKTQTKTSSTPLNKQDIEFVMTHMQLSKVQAEKALRQNDGDLVATLNYLVQN